MVGVVPEKWPADREVPVCESCFNGEHQTFGWKHYPVPEGTEEDLLSRYSCKNVGMFKGKRVQCACSAAFEELLKALGKHKKASVYREAVKKGDIRNTVLREVKILEKARKLLDQGRKIKEDEVGEFKRTNPAKTRKLKTQIKIITQGLRHLGEALKSLDKYKGTSTKTASAEPSFFKKTQYRLPSKEELIEIDSCNLSVPDLRQGFGYAIIGRGMLGQGQKDMLIKSSEILCDMFPDNETYKSLLEHEKKLAPNF